jgi:hypothetical protein
MDATRAEHKPNQNAGTLQESGGLANFGFSTWDYCQDYKQDGEQTTHNNSLEKCTHITNPSSPIRRHSGSAMTCFLSNSTPIEACRT